MYAPGHVGLALLAFAPLGFTLLATDHVRVAAAGTAVSVLVSTLPDVDQFVAALPHRGPTHTVLFAVTLGLSLGALGAAFPVGRRLTAGSSAPVGAWMGLAGLSSASSHLLGDAITPMGLRPLVPLSDAHVTLSLVAARDPRANAVLLLAGTTTTAAYWWHGTGTGTGAGTGDEPDSRPTYRAILVALRDYAPTGVLGRRSLR